jgi:signal transduction histidine kinase
VYRNNLVIAFNKQQQEDAEKIKVNTVDVIRSLHLLDLSVRSYAFVKNEHYMRATGSAINRNSVAFLQLEAPLKSQNFPMPDFYHLRDSVNAYIELTRDMLALVNKGNIAEFVNILDKDPGYKVWLQFGRFSKQVNAFEDEIARQAKLRYEEALRNSYLLQILLFLISIPTLAYTAFQANRTLSLSEQLRKSEMEKSRILLDQNKLLERTVHERTREILAQNEEISSQNEEIVAHNEQLLMQQREIEIQRNNLHTKNEKLQEAKRTIEIQSQLIQQKNNELVVEVERQTHDLKRTNLELIEQNNRLEQFAFIISHNLRAPLARLIGLSNILDFAKDETEATEIVRLIVKSTHDLDQIIKDLTLILGIQKTSSLVIGQIRLDDMLYKILNTLEEEIKETQASVKFDFTGVESLTSLNLYVESILYNLVSNAIKYRHPDRLPRIAIQSKLVNGYVQIDVSDNGIGIDMAKHRDYLFSLYKRFHFHVEGKGMGLYLVKTQVEALGGRIEIESKVNEGTTFSIFLRES